MVRYVILTLKVQTFDHDYSGKHFYSAVYGCFSKLRYASTYFNFEDSQSTVKRLRKQLPFVYAVQIDIKELYKCYE